jgi:hypothetical protein
MQFERTVAASFQAAFAIFIVQPWGCFIKLRLFILLVIIAGAGALYYRYLRRPEKHPTPSEVAYVLPPTLDVEDTPAILRRTVATVQNGAKLVVLGKTEHWAEVRIPSGIEGWVPLESLQAAGSFDNGLALLKQLEQKQIQAVGHTDTDVNLHLKPALDAPVLARLPANLHIDVYDRRIVPREVKPAQLSGKARTDVWYEVRTTDRAGWMLGRFVDLDVPPGLAMYAQGVNLVAWLVLDDVDDGGHQVPQYIAADRIGVRDFDFNHIRVFTWWKKHHRYVTAYVQSGVDGYFPILVNHIAGIPYFRLRLVDQDGNKIQRVYGLFDTIVKPIGTEPGWESNAMPSKPQRSTHEIAKRVARLRRRRR